MTTLVFTVIGDDRAGLVDTLASPIAAHHGSWQRSHLARLAGKFAGIVVVDVPNDEADALVADIEAITSQGLLHARVAVAGADNETRGSRELHVQLVGQDRPGIVHEIARALAARGVSIAELETRTESASMSGEHLFHAAMSIRVPDDADPDDVQAALEHLGDEMMVDLEVATRPQVP